MAIKPIKNTIVRVHVRSGRGISTFFKNIGKKLKSVFQSKRLLKTLKKVGTVAKRVSIPVLQTVLKETLPILTNVALKKISSKFDSPLIKSSIMKVGQKTSTALSKVLVSELGKTLPSPKKTTSKTSKRPKRSIKKGGRTPFSKNKPIGILAMLLSRSDGPKVNMGRGIMLIP